MSRLSVKGVQVLLIVALCAANGWGHAAQSRASVKGHYLLVWAGDRAKVGNDFLAVIDADPSSPAYGHLVTSLATDQRTERVHHTEYTMPASGMLFANDHDVGRTFIFDVRDPLKTHAQRHIWAALEGLGPENPTSGSDPLRKRSRPDVFVEVGRDDRRHLGRY
jgi:56kDa selenium binding protein (SBP56)